MMRRADRGAGGEDLIAVGDQARNVTSPAGAGKGSSSSVRILGVGEWGLYEGTPVIWKLDVHPAYRGRGIGPRLIAGIVDRLPEGAPLGLRSSTSPSTSGRAPSTSGRGFHELRRTAHATPVLSVVWRERSLGSPSKRTDAGARHLGDVR
jgi:GNAT superfamily N-acetyltransferase